MVERVLTYLISQGTSTSTDRQTSLTGPSSSTAWRLGQSGSHGSTTTITSSARMLWQVGAWSWINGLEIFWRLVDYGSSGRGGSNRFPPIIGLLKEQQEWLGLVSRTCLNLNDYFGETLGIWNLDFEWSERGQFLEWDLKYRSQIIWNMDK